MIGLIVNRPASEICKDNWILWSVGERVVPMTVLSVKHFEECVHISVMGRTLILRHDDLVPTVSGP